MWLALNGITKTKTHTKNDEIKYEFNMDGSSDGSYPYDRKCEC